MSMSLQAWADAMVVDKQLGPDAERHVADQIDRHTSRGDEVEAARWRRVGRALNAMREAKAPAPVESAQPERPVPPPVERASTPRTPADR